jgi:predicted DNA-binding transcriptional regulator AlpA
VAPTLLTKKEVASMIRKSEAGLNWMIQNGTAPRGAKIGGRLYWREADVLAWIDAQFEECAA